MFCSAADDLPEADEADRQPAGGDEAACDGPPLRFQNNPRSAIVTRTLETAGLRPTGRADYNLLWQKKFLNTFQMRSLRPEQRVNHFPGMNFLTHKVPPSPLIPAPDPGRYLVQRSRPAYDARTAHAGSAGPHCPRSSRL